MAAGRPGLSLVTDYGEHGSSCGYCGREEPASVSHGMMAESLSVECYQALLDRGWRRSGRWLYCPLQELSCCQLLTIRLDVTRFAPNKEQRRVQRRWEAYLAGAPLRPEQPQAGQQAEHAAAQQAEHAAPAGSSPKRQHDELLGGSAAWDLAMAAQQGGGGGGGGAGEGGGGKRLRHDGQEWWGEESDEGREPRGASPTAQLREQLQQALRGGRLPEGEPAEAAEPPPLPPPPQQQQQQQGGQAPQQAPAQAAAAAAPAAAGSAGDARLAGQLAAALQAAVAAGQLPAAAYPPPRVQQPSAKQKKLLPTDVTLTTPFPLAAAAAAARALAAGGDGGDRSVPSADSVAALLLQHLPAELAGAAHAARGHLNFAVPLAAAAPPAAAAAAAGGAASGGPAAQPHPQPQGRGTGEVAASAASAVQQAVPRGVPRHFELRTVRASEPGLVEAELPLFKKYQVVHHGDKPGEVTARSFRRFLVESPLRHAGPEEYPPGACPPLGFGSFHQQYWLDGRLVAVGVVDVLPRCLSSKYLFWDTDLGPLSLGKLTSLAEIEWVRQLHATCPSLRYYYLGFYIHTCHRMRYKGDFAPSDLLCPLGKCWVPLERVKAALDQPGRVALCEVPGALEGLGEEHGVDPASRRPACPPREPSKEELESLKLLVQLPGQQPRALTLGLLRQAGLLRGGSALTDPLKRWWRLAGPAAASMCAFAV